MKYKMLDCFFFAEWDAGDIKEPLLADVLREG